MDILDYIDDNTLIYAVVATYFSAFLIFMLLKQHYGTQLTKRLKYGYLLLGIGFLLIGLRAYIPDFFTIILANLMTITGSYFVVAGYLYSTEIVIKVRLFSIPIFIFLLVHLYFTYIQNNINARIINYSAFMILVMLIYCYHAIKYLIRKFQSAYLIILITYIIYMLYHLYRLLNAFKSQLFLDLFRDAPIFKGFLLISFFVEITRILILMIHKANTHMVEENQS